MDRALRARSGGVRSAPPTRIGKALTMRTISLILWSVLLTASSAPAQIRNIGPIVADYKNKSIPVRVSANVPELDNLARLAFNAHGRYRLETGGQFDIRFTQVGPTQVRVDITRGDGSAFASENVTGNNARHALLRAADVAVER